MNAKAKLEAQENKQCIFKNLVESKINERGGLLVCLRTGVSILPNLNKAVDLYTGVLCTMVNTSVDALNFIRHINKW